jgi:hypothetical protein
MSLIDVLGIASLFVHIGGVQIAKTKVIEVEAVRLYFRRLEAIACQAHL